MATRILWLGLSIAAWAAVASCGNSDRLTAADTQATTSTPLAASPATAEPLPLAPVATLHTPTPFAPQDATATGAAAASPPSPVPTLSPSPSPSPSPTPSPVASPTLYDLTATVSASSHASYALGLFSCTVLVSNRSSVGRTGSVTATFVHSGTPESGSPPQTQAVTVPAAGSAQLVFTDLKWHLLSEEATLEVKTDPYLPTATPAPAVSFKADVAPLFASRCAGCHTATGAGGNKVVIFASAGVVSYAQVSGAITRILPAVQSGTMPQGGTRLTPLELATLQQWGAAGAPDN